VNPQILENRAMSGVAPELPEWLTAFKPRRGLSNGHVQTIVGNYLPRPVVSMPTVAETVEVDPKDGSRVLCHCHWQAEPVRTERLTLVLVHGLEGSSDSYYIQGIAGRGWAAGCNVVRMNMRNCGGTDTLTPTLYHSGLSGDLAAVVNHYAERYGLERVALVGYSMGGNLVLKMAGEWGRQRPLCAVAAVCPSIDLAAGSDALHEPMNRLYEWYFLHKLLRRFHRKAELFPCIYKTAGTGSVHSIHQFDDKILSRFSNFRDADDYYDRAASAHVVDKITVPTLVLCAKDDPFVRLLPETRAKLVANPQITFVEARHGGHCAFLSGDSGNEIHWAEATLIRYLLTVDRHQHGR
jgi:predicted alpha/beta-fold hydrolase